MRRISKGEKKRVANRLRPGYPKSYSHHDRKHVYMLLSAWDKTRPDMPPTRLDIGYQILSARIVQSNRAYLRWRGDFNKYDPYQGKKECERRSSQPNRT